VFADFATVAPLERVMGVAMRGDDQICGSLFSYIDFGGADLEIELSFHDGDDAILTAHRENDFFSSLLGTAGVAEEAGVEPTEDAWRPPTGLKPARVTGPDALPK